MARHISVCGGLPLTAKAASAMINHMIVGQLVNQRDLFAVDEALVAPLADSLIRQLADWQPINSYSH